MKATLNTLFSAGLLSAILLTPCRAQLLWTGNLGSGWTSLVGSQTAAGEPCSIAYNSTSGLVRFDAIDHSGGGYGTPVYSNGLNYLGNQVIQQGLTHVVPFRIASTQYLYLYNQANGQMLFDKVNATCTSLQTVYNSQLSRTVTVNQFTQFAVYYLNGAPHIIAYNETTGAISFQMVNPNAAGSTTVWSGNVGANWTNLITLSNSQGVPYFLLYKKATDDLKLNQINPASQGFTHILLTWQNSDFTSFVASPTDGWKFIAYKAPTGAAYVDKFINNGASYTVLDIGGWDTGVTSIAPFYFKVPIDMGQTAAIGCLIYYRATDGQARIHLF